MRGRLRKVRWNVLLGVSSHDNYSASLRSSAASSSDIAIVYLLSTCNAILKDLTPLLHLLCSALDPFVPLCFNCQHGVAVVDGALQLGEIACDGADVSRRRVLHVRPN